MENKNIQSIIDVTMEKLRAMVDADTVIGTPVTVGENTIIPVSKVAFGLATGGSDFPSKNQNELFGGGGGAGVTVTPIGFILTGKDNTKFVPITNEITTVDRAIAAAPELIEKIKDIVTK